jgi:hypothetical protein
MHYYDARGGGLVPSLPLRPDARAVLAPRKPRLALTRWFPRQPEVYRYASFAPRGKHVIEMPTWSRALRSSAGLIAGVRGYRRAPPRGQRLHLWSHGWQLCELPRRLTCLHRVVERCAPRLAGRCLCPVSCAGTVTTLAAAPPFVAGSFVPAIRRYLGSSATVCAEPVPLSSTVPWAKARRHRFGSARGGLSGPHHPM